MSKIIKDGKADIQTTQGQLERVYGGGVRYVSDNDGTTSIGHLIATQGQITIQGSPLSPSPAAKNDQSKPDLSLIPQVLLVEIAKAFMVGEKKYGRYNYTKGHNASQLVAAALRHLTAWNDGQDYDPTDGQHHLGSVGACIGMILRQAELGTLKDNRFKKDEK